MVALVDTLAGQLESRTDLPAVCLGRLGGQFAKPRSQAAESDGDQRRAAYRGDAVNSREGCPIGRTADPRRLRSAHAQATRVRDWLPNHLHSSHEALLLPYESALTRMIRGRAWATSAHSLWLGERTRDPEGAHVEYLRGIANPIGIKCGPGITPEQIKILLGRLDPQPARFVLAVNLGRSGAEGRH